MTDLKEYILTIGAAAAVSILLYKPIFMLVDWAMQLVTGGQP